MHATTCIADRLALVVLTVNIWSGRKKLRPEDLKLGADVPPEDLVSLGSKRVCDPQALRVFHQTKKAAERACLAVGTRFLGGFAIPAERAESVDAALAREKERFENAARSFLADYDRAIEEWIATLPAWEEPIRRAIEPAAAVGARLRFGYQLLRIAPAQTPGTFAEEVAGLGEGVFAEASQLARELDASFAGKDRLNRRALGTFRRIREKLACLSFVDPRIQPVADAIDDWLGRVPAEGAIAGATFAEGMGLALLLGDSARMARYGTEPCETGTAEADRDPDLSSAATPEPDAPPSGWSFADLDAELDAWFGPSAARAPVAPGEATAATEAGSFFF